MARKNRWMYKGTCSDCGTQCTTGAQRCRKCWNASRLGPDSKPVGEMKKARIRAWHKANPERKKAYYAATRKGKGTCEECGGPCTDTARICRGCFIPPTWDDTIWKKGDKTNGKS